MLMKLISLTRFIPPQYKGAAVLVGLLALFGGGMWVGWKTQGWRLGSDISDLSNDLRTCQGNVATYADAVKAQNESIRDAKAKADARQKAAQEALELAQSESSTLEAEIRALRRARGETCEDADKLLNEALGL